MYALCNCYGTDFLSLQKLPIYTLPKPSTEHIRYKRERGFFFKFMWPCIVTNFFIIRPTRWTNFEKIIFGMKLYIFRTVPLSIIRSSFIVHSAMVYVIQVCRQLTSNPGPVRKLSTNLYDIYHCWVYNEWTPDDGQRHCPKYVEFHAKNIFFEISASSWSYYKEKEAVLSTLISQTKGTSTRWFSGF